MKLIKPSFKILSGIDGEAILKEMEIAARTCYKSEGKIVIGTRASDGKEIATSARTLIAKLIERGHFAMLEFGGSITVKFICDRGVSHELVRHRLASFAQESTRYCNYGKDEHIQFIIPSWTNIPEIVIEDRDDLNLLVKGEYVDIFKPSQKEASWLYAIDNCESTYNFLIQSWTPQQARSVLPNSLKTEINVSANIREWRHIFTQRCAKVAHPQMRELMIPLHKEFKKLIPILFDDITY